LAQKYDIIIVGSGLGGLVCGYILAKNGYKTAIFEKNSQIGGCLQSFTRKGVRFGTGMHYIGSLDKGQIMHKFFKYLNLLDNVPVNRMDKNCYEVISIGGERYEFACGQKNFVNTLAKKFPENRTEIEDYAQKIREIAESSPLYNLQQINSNNFIDTEYFTTSIYDFVSSITKNTRLQSVLMGNLSLYAGVKDKTPIYVCALMNNFYMQSAWRIVGGSEVIANSLAKSIENFGGKIYRNAEVEEMLCDDKKMTKICLTDGRQFEADYFIANIHPQIAIDKIKSNLLRKAYRDRIKEIENTISTFTVFIKFKKNKIKYLNHNFYYHDSENIWENENYNEENYPKNYLYMHQSGAEGEQFAESAEIVAFMKYDDVKCWENTKIGKRGTDYEAFKLQKARKLIDKVAEQFPDLKENIEAFWTASPLTYRDYTATAQGSMYGILRDRNFPIQTRVSQRTKIPNFFFTGQNINSHGILGVTIGAITTAAEIVDKETIVKQIEESQQDR
jgi:all-trans-retinol 13,14-reductase